MKDILVVVDVINGFLNFGNLSDKEIGKILPNVTKLIKSSIKNKTDIVAFQDSHTPYDEEFLVYPVHCLQGSEESELVPELKPFESNMLSIKKNTTNGFITPEFQSIVESTDFDNVYVVGCCTDICVENFVNSYLDYIYRNNKNTKITVYEDACYTFDGENHNAKEAHKQSILRMQSAGAKIAQCSGNNNSKNSKTSEAEHEK